MKFTYLIELEVTPTTEAVLDPEAYDALKEEIADDLDAAPLGPWTIKRKKYELTDWIIKAQ